MFFFFNDTATTEIYTLSLHDALPISAAVLQPDARPLPGEQVRRGGAPGARGGEPGGPLRRRHGGAHARDRKSTRLNSSHANISYAVFCLKQKYKSALNTPRTFASKNL